MLSIPSSNFSWPSPPANSTVTPTQPVTPVSGVQSGGNNPQAGLGYGQEGHGAQRPERSDQPDDGRASAEKSKEAFAAPLLPRQNPEKQEGKEASASGQEALAEDDRERLAQAQKDAEERTQALREQLREVLSNVWQASAAVVERALQTGDASAAAATAANESLASNIPQPDPTQPVNPSAAPAASLEYSPFESASPEAESVAALRAGAGALASSDLGPVQAYDARGQGSRAQAATGNLVDQRA